MKCNIIGEILSFGKHFLIVNFLIIASQAGHWSECCNVLVVMVM